MAREEEWADPEIQALLMDLRASIDRYRHKKRNTSRPKTPLSTVDECGDKPGEPAECFTAPKPEIPGRDKLRLTVPA